MDFRPKILYNPLSTPFEFMQGGNLYIFEPHEKKLLNGEVIYHVLNNMSNCPLQEYVPEEVKEEVTDVDYYKMNWKVVVSLASKRGVYKPGYTKDQTVKALIELDEQHKAKYVRSPFEQEETKGS